MKRIVDVLFDRLRLRHFLIIFVLSVPLTAYLLRQNNLTMIELRDIVLQVDRDTGDINEVAPHLENLGNYILNHMNTDAGKVELPGTFNSAVERIRKRAEASGSVNSAIYAQAQDRCEDPNILLTARAQCVQDFVVSNAKPGTDVIELEFPDKTLYSYSFASPTWSPDVAGFSLLISVMSFVVLVFLSITRIILPVISRFVDRDPLE